MATTEPSLCPPLVDPTSRNNTPTSKDLHRDSHSFLMEVFHARVFFIKGASRSWIFISLKTNNTNRVKLDRTYQVCDRMYKIHRGPAPTRHRRKFKQRQITGEID
jgi:hypothetical protein